MTHIKSQSQSIYNRGVKQAHHHHDHNQYDRGVKQAHRHHNKKNRGVKQAHLQDACAQGDQAQDLDAAAAFC